MRDKIKDKQYFIDFIKSKDSVNKQNHQRFRDGIIKGDNIRWYKMNTFTYNLSILTAKFSMGVSINEFKNEYVKLLVSMTDGWVKDYSKVMDDEENISDQYLLSPYATMLYMLSLGYLLNVTDDEFNILVALIDRDGISDNLYEFIIRARFPNRLQQKDEIYSKEHSYILKVYKKLRLAIFEKNSTKASELVSSYLEKDFYHKECNFYRFHTKDYLMYYGYWSFEAAAIVKIMDLEDATFIDHQYYPKDLVYPPKQNNSFLDKFKNFLTL